MFKHFLRIFIYKKVLFHWVKGFDFYLDPESYPELFVKHLNNPDAVLLVGSDPDEKKSLFGSETLF